MPDLGFFPVTCRLTWGKLRASWFPLFAAMLFAGFLAWLGLTNGAGTAMSAFLIIFPHTFLILAQDMVKADVDGGALDNVLFIQGHFREYLWQKNFFLMAVGTAYSALLFIVLAVFGSSSGGVGWTTLTGYAIGLLAGYYYVAMAGLLSYFVKSGSNTVLFIILQVAAFFVLMFSAASRSGLLEQIGAGRFHDLRSRLIVRGMAAVFPNLAVLGRLRGLWWQVLAGVLIGLIVQKRLAGRVELKT